MQWQYLTKCNSCEFASHLNNELFSYPGSGATQSVALSSTTEQYLNNWPEYGEWSVLTLGSSAYPAVCSMWQCAAKKVIFIKSKLN